MEGVVHLAAMSRSGPSNELVDLCTQSNIVGTQNMLLAAREAGIKRFVYAGSATAYGNLPPPHREDGPLQFLNIYALSKKTGEEYCLLFDRDFGVPAVVLRYFSAYGPRQPQTGAYALVLESDVRGKVLNVGSGTNISVKELAGMISSNHIHTEARRDDSMATLADISRTRAALGWEPKVSFAEGLQELR
jgi:nucleoside-diphosphate-sugar epimerase